MTRMSKQARRRAVSPRRPTSPGIKTGAKKDNLEAGYKEKPNAIEGAHSSYAYIGKIS